MSDIEGGSKLNKIMSLIRDVEPYYKNFTKNYCLELQFMQKKIQKDAIKLSKVDNCSCMCFREHDSIKTMTKSYEKYNPRFYRLFKKMSVEQRQSYFLQLLAFIQQLNKIYHGIGDLTYIKKNSSCKKLKTQLINDLFSQFIDCKMNHCEEECDYFEVVVQTEKQKLRKIGKMLKFKLYLYFKENGQQKQDILDIRNYLIVGQITQTQLCLQSFYHSVLPLWLKIKFVNAEAGKNYIKLIQQLVQIGKIQKLVQGIDYSKVFGSQYEQLKNPEKKNQIFTTSFFGITEDSDNQNQFIIGSEQLFDERRKKSKQKIQRYNTLNLERQTQIRKSLIDTLLFLAKRKQEENKRIYEFLTKKAISHQRAKSEAVDKLLLSKQNYIQCDNKKIATQLVNGILGKEQNLITQNNKTFTEKQQANQQKKQQKREYFSEEKGWGRMKEMSQGNSKNQKHSSGKEKYFKNNCIIMYPNINILQLGNTNSGVVKMKIDQKLCDPPKYVTANRSGSALSKSIQLWFRELNDNCSVYLDKKNDNWCKIIINVKIQINALVEALSNVLAFQLWHPDVKQTSVLQTISSQNIVKYKMKCKFQSGSNHVFHLIMHVFKIEQKYYIAQKSFSVNTEEKDQRGFLSKTFFSKDQFIPSSFKLFIIRITNLRKDGLVEISITTQFDSQEAKIQKTKKDYLQFFLNYKCIFNYWKKSSKGQSKALFNSQWLINKNDFNPDYQSNAKSNKQNKQRDHQGEQLHQIGQVKAEIDQLNSCSQILSQKFYDF